MEDERDWRDGPRVGAFLNLLFATDSATMVFFLIVRECGRIPATIPITIGPVLPFKAQAIALALCTATILLLRLASLFWSREHVFQRVSLALCVVLLAVSLVAIGSGGLSFLNDPSLLRSE